MTRLLNIPDATLNEAADKIWTYNSHLSMEKIHEWIYDSLKAGIVQTCAEYGITMLNFRDFMDVSSRTRSIDVRSAISATNPTFKVRYAQGQEEKRMETVSVSTNIEIHGLQIDVVVDGGRSSTSYDLERAIEEAVREILTSDSRVDSLDYIDADEFNLSSIDFTVTLTITATGPSEDAVLEQTKRVIERTTACGNDVEFDLGSVDIAVEEA